MARAARELLVRRRRRDLDRGRPAQGQRRDDRIPGRAGLQPHLRRHPGLRPRSAGGGEPHPVRGRDAHGDGRGAPLRVRVGQRRPDLRTAAADGGGFLEDSRPRDRRVARPHRALQLRARAAPVQAAAPHRDRGAPAAAGKARDPRARDREARGRGLRVHRHGPLREAHATSSPPPSANASCTATSRATRRARTATSSRSASRRSARSAPRTPPT